LKDVSDEALYFQNSVFVIFSQRNIIFGGLILLCGEWICILYNVVFHVQGQIKFGKRLPPFSSESLCLPLCVVKM
jgi:hypothetical protein